MISSPKEGWLSNLTLFSASSFGNEDYIIASSSSDEDGGVISKFILRCAYIFICMLVLDGCSE